MYLSLDGHDYSPKAFSFMRISWPVCQSQLDASLPISVCSACNFAAQMTFRYHGIPTSDLLYTAQDFWRFGAEDFITSSNITLDATQQVHIKVRDGILNRNRLNRRSGGGMAADANSLPDHSSLCVHISTSCHFQTRPHESCGRFRCFTRNLSSFCLSLHTFC